MKTLSVLLGLIVFFSISVSTVFAGGIIHTPTVAPDTPIFVENATATLVDNPGFIGDTPTFNEIHTAVLSPPDCATPGSNDWIIMEDCFLNSNFNAPRNVMVQNGAILIIPNGVTLDIDFSLRNITVEFGSGVLIKAGGSIT
jgi:hypothetical protein